MGWHLVVSQGARGSSLMYRTPDTTGNAGIALRPRVVGDSLRETAQALGECDQQGLRDSRSMEQATPEKVSGNAQNPEGTILRPDGGDPGAAIEKR